MSGLADKAHRNTHTHTHTDTDTQTHAEQTTMSGPECRLTRTCDDVPVSVLHAVLVLLGGVPGR